MYKGGLITLLIPGIYLILISFAICSADALGKQSTAASWDCLLGCADWLMAYAGPTMAKQTWSEGERGRIVCTAKLLSTGKRDEATAKSAVHVYSLAEGILTMA